MSEANTVRLSGHATYPEPMMFDRRGTVSIARSELHAFLEENSFFRALSRFRAAPELRILVPPMLAALFACGLVVGGVKVAASFRRLPRVQHRVVMRPETRSVVVPVVAGVRIRPSEPPAAPSRVPAVAPSEPRVASAALARSTRVEPDVRRPKRKIKKRKRRRRRRAPRTQHVLMPLE